MQTGLLPVIPVDGKRSYPPRISTLTQTFWTSLRQGRLVTTGCKSCGKQTFPPKVVCPHCWSGETDWSDLPSTGVLYSWTRIHAAPTAFTGEVPYSVGIVDLDCGIRVACRLVETQDQVEFHPSMKMKLVVLQFSDGPLLAARAG